MDARKRSHEMIGEVPKLNSVFKGQVIYVLRYIKHNLHFTVGRILYGRIYWHITVITIWPA